MKAASDPQRAYRERVAALFARLDRLVPDYGTDLPETEAKRPRKRCRFTILRHAIKLLKLVQMDTQMERLLRVAEERSQAAASRVIEVATFRAGPQSTFGARDSTSVHAERYTMGSSTVPAQQIGGSVPFTANIFPSLNTTLTAVTAATGVKSELVAHMHDEGGSASPAAFSSGKACGEGSQLVSPLFKQQQVDHADSSHLRDFREPARSHLSFGQQWTHDQQPFNLVASQPTLAQADTSSQPVPTVPQLGAGWAIDSFLHSLEDSEPSAGSAHHGQDHGGRG
mmetsp:Transcript_48653/g.97468  ORF Transcript_48653/g.97468 Transcript_48653/m.97468 type:complete len:283 (-) Transcript_48653:426-1274(-)